MIPQIWLFLSAYPKPKSIKLKKRRKLLYNHNNQIKTVHLAILSLQYSLQIVPILLMLSCMKELLLLLESIGMIGLSSLRFLHLSTNRKYKPMLMIWDHSIELPSRKMSHLLTLLRQDHWRNPQVETSLTLKNSHMHP